MWSLWIIIAVIITIIFGLFWLLILDTLKNIYKTDFWESYSKHLTVENI